MTTASKKNAVNEDWNKDAWDDEEYQKKAAEEAAGAADFYFRLDDGEDGILVLDRRYRPIVSVLHFRGTGTEPIPCKGKPENLGDLDVTKCKACKKLQTKPTVKRTFMVWQYEGGVWCPKTLDMNGRNGIKVQTIGSATPHHSIFIKRKGEEIKTRYTIKAHEEIDDYETLYEHFKSLSKPYPDDGPDKSLHGVIMHPCHPAMLEALFPEDDDE